MNAIVSNPTAVGPSIINTNTASTIGMKNIYPAAGSAGHSGVVSPPSRKNLESAIYAHIQAVRALGRMTVNTVEISKALGLSLADVDRIVKLLKEKGVRVIG
jgi:hypothetical protein